MSDFPWSLLRVQRLIFHFYSLMHNVQFLIPVQPRASTIPPPPPFVIEPPSFEDEVVPLKGLKKAMVKSMQQSLRIPHFGYNDEIDVTELIE